MIKKILLSLLAAGLVHCTAEDPEEQDNNDVGVGEYLRFETTPIELQPGESGLYAQWISNPTDRDLDIVDLKATQSTGGHHALLYSSMQSEEPGTTREWQDSDQLVTRFLGGIGGPTGEPVVLPEGLVFRVPAGSSLMIQTHYLNVGDEPIMGSSTFDIKFEEASDERDIVSMFAINVLDVDIPDGGETSAEVECELPQDVEIVMWANHMHEFGKTVDTQEVAGDSEDTFQWKDSTWDYEWASNPNFGSTLADEPVVLEKGNTLKTSCSWLNESGSTIGFPDEMCTFFAFYKGDEDLLCVDGRWQNR